jgi:hypothetical protein
MMRNILIGFLILGCLDAMGCSGFVFKKHGKLYLCASVDQAALHGYIIVNPRNTTKTSFWADNEKLIKWTSKYGSVTFSTIGREFPTGGMNEEGLSVAIMTTPSMEYPAKDDRFAINESQWIQYILDNYSSTDQILQSDSLIRVNRFFDNWHYMISDKNGETIIIEFKNGKMNAYKDSLLPFPVLENNLYENSIQKYKRDKSNFQLSSRFSKLAYIMENMDSTSYNEPKQMFPILDNVSQESTKWQIVYDIQNRQIYFRANTYRYLTAKGSKNYEGGTTGIRSINFKDIDFTKGILATKFGIIDNTRFDFLKQLKPYNEVFDKEMLMFTLDIFKKQGAKYISNDLVDKYLRLSSNNDFCETDR